MEPQFKICITVIGTCLATYSNLTFPQEKTQNQSVMLEEIKVTGEKFERSQSATSSSVDVKTDTDFKKAGNAVSVANVLKQSVNLVDIGLGNDLPAVRGVDGSGPAVGAVAFLAGTRPRLNMQIDGRTSTYNELAFGTKSLWDIKQVEVYRGAQSYAQGRNAMAGAVVMSSNDPTHEFEGTMKFNAGSQNTRQMAAMISGPLIKDELAFRLSVDRQRRTSYVDLISYEPVGDPRLYETTTTRAKLLWTPSALPQFYNRYTFNHIKSRSPQNEMENNTSSRRFDPRRPVFKTRSASHIWDVGYEFSPDFQLENKLVYTRYIHDRLTAPTTQNGVPARVDGSEFQLEPIFRFGNKDSQYHGLLGAFYFRGHQDDWVILRNIKNSFNDKTDTHAIFGELTVRPLEQFEMTLSARYEREHHQRHGGSSIFKIDRNKTYNVFLPKVDLAWLPNDNHRLGIKVGRGYNPGGAGVTFGRPYTSYEYDAEYVWNYELYHRWNTLNNRLQINSNLFYSDYKDMQLPYYLGTNSVVIRNADKVATYGAEINANWQATDEFQLYAGLGLLKTEIKKYPNSRIEGNKLARSPSYTAVLGGRYMLPKGFEIGADMRFTNGYYSTYTNERAGKVEAYSQTNLYFAYNFKHGRIMLYADNVFDSRKIITSTPATGATSPDITKQQPRVIGISTELKF
ncbi:TonB-dependent receptor [Bisgaard Taxon 10/6]|uniref:TonB-dependent receptor n=1 Tax=Exercitatus varius TaxID=67857 RepID=UPI00294B733E|nr:TonB-dependent receptor [Exercitatus varius]MDG2939788.1 TonB-dependent receptor [Exercitatus varius]